MTHWMFVAMRALDQACRDKGNGLVWWLGPGQEICDLVPILWGSDAWW